MNAVRRKSIADILTRLEAAKAALEAVRDEEQEYFDNMPEAIQAGAKGDAAQAGLAALEEAVDAIEQAIEPLQTL